MSEIFSIARRNHVAKKFEETFGLIAFPLLLLALWALVGNYRNYRSLVDQAGTFHLSNMKVTFRKGAGYKGGFSSVSGFILDKKADSSNILGVLIGRSSVKDGKREVHYYDSKYENVWEGDTIPVWYSANLKRVGLVFPNGFHGLIDFEKQELMNEIRTGFMMLAFPFSIYFIARRLRNYYQNKVT